MSAEVIKILIILLAATGAMLSGYIRIKKARKHPLVCPIGESCDDVINSKYSILFGVRVETLGLMYYGAIAVSYALIVLNPEYDTINVLTAIFAVTAMAFLFSVYSTILQAFILKKWCAWCVTSAVLSTGIFLCSFLV